MFILLQQLQSLFIYISQKTFSLHLLHDNWAMPRISLSVMAPSKSPTSLVPFLQVMAEEFSHTVIHRKPLGVFGQQRMPPKQPAKPAPGQFSNVAILNNFMLYTKCTCKSCLVLMLLSFNNEVFIIVINNTNVLMYCLFLCVQIMWIFSSATKVQPT